MLNLVMLSVVTLSIFMLNIVMLSVVMLSVVAPIYLSCAVGLEGGQHRLRGLQKYLSDFDGTLLSTLKNFFSFHHNSTREPLLKRNGTVDLLVLTTLDRSYLLAGQGILKGKVSRYH